MNVRELVRTFAAVLAVGLASSWVGPVKAEFPENPIKILVPYGPGGATSALTQLLVEPYEEELGVPVVIVNEGGGGGRVGTATAARAKADGYNLLMAPAGALTVGWQMANTGYTPDDFETIGIFSFTPSGIAVRRDSPYTTLKELIDAGKNLKYATYGIGGAAHLGTELLAEDVGWDVTVVGAQGGKEALRKLLSGEVDFVTVAATNLPPFFAKGEDSELRILAMLTPDRWKFLPEVPTAREQGYDAAVADWLGLMAPKGTPEPVLTRLREATAKIMALPETEARFAKFYQDPEYIDHAAFRALIEEDSAKYKGVLQKLGLYHER